MGDAVVPRHGGVLLHQVQHRLLGIIPRLVHRAVSQGHGEVQQKAVALGDPLLGVDVQGGQHPGKEKGVGIAQNGRPQGDGRCQGQPGPLPLGGTHPQQKQIAHQQNGRLDDVLVHGIVKAVGHVGRRPPPSHVGREQNAPAKAQDIVVQQPHQKGQDRRQSCRPAQPAQDQTADKEQGIVPDQVHGHLPDIQVLEYIVLVEHLHHPQAQPGTQQEHQPGQISVQVLPKVPPQPLQGVFSFFLYHGFLLEIRASGPGSCVIAYRAGEKKQGGRKIFLLPVSAIYIFFCIFILCSFPFSGPDFPVSRKSPCFSELFVYLSIDCA